MTDKRRLSGHTVNDDFYRPFKEPEAADSSNLRDLSGKDVTELVKQKKNTSVKLKHKKDPVFANSPTQQKLAAKKRFDELADRIVSNRKDRDKSLLELAKSMDALIKDKTLRDNKTVVQKMNEDSVRKELIDIAIEKDNDLEMEKFVNMGSMTLINFLFKICSYQRDEINQLAYSIEQKGAALKILQEKVFRLENPDAAAPNKSRGLRVDTSTIEQSDE